MQKFIYFQAYNGKDNGLGEINALLEDGWKVIEINAFQQEDNNIEMVVLIEKE